MKYTEEQIAYLREIIPGRPYKEIAKMFNERYGTDKSEKTLSQVAGRRGIRNGFDGRFVKGQVSWNKGKKMSPELYERLKPTFFKKGQNCRNHKEIGSERVTVDGYVEIKVAEPKKWRQKHVYVWEQANGPVPKGMVLIFKDNNRQNTDLDNLMLVSRAEHMTMNKYKLRSEKPELTETGILVSKLIMQTKKRRQEGKKNG